MRVALSANAAAGSHGADRMAIRVRTLARSRCSVTVSARRARQTFGTATTDRHGRLGVRWQIPATAPSGRWAIRVGCRRGKSRGGASDSIVIFTSNRHGSTGPLVSPSSAVVASGGGSAGCDSNPGPEDNRYCYRQCTWYAKERFPQIPNGWGNAGDWARNAAGRYRVDGSPEVHALVTWGYNQIGGGYGHVAVIEEIREGRLRVAEYNYVPLTFTNTRWVSAAEAGRLHYIHIADSSAASPFAASLDGQFPMDGAGNVTLSPGDSTVFGFNVRFNQRFQTDFVLRPTTPGYAGHFVHFADGRAGNVDFPGAMAPNDSSVGYYRANGGVPPGTPRGRRFLQWNVARAGTGQIAGGIQPSFSVVVRQPSLRSTDWALRNSNSSGAGDVGFKFATPGDIPVVGDWNGDGVPTPGVFRPSNATWYLRNSNSSGANDVVPFVYGEPGDVPIVGDWNNDGVDTVGVFRPNSATWWLRNSNTGGPQDTYFQYGDPDDLPVVGDWNGDGGDTIGVFRPTTTMWYLRDLNSAGQATHAFQYAGPLDIPVAGDWNHDGIDTIGVFRPENTTWFLRNANSGGPSEAPFRFGNPTDVPLAGDWNHDGTDTVGIAR